MGRNPDSNPALLKLMILCKLRVIKYDVSDKTLGCLYSMKIWKDISSCSPYSYGFK